MNTERTGKQMGKRRSFVVEASRRMARRKAYRWQEQPERQDFPKLS